MFYLDIGVPLQIALKIALKTDFLVPLHELN